MKNIAKTRYIGFMIVLATILFVASAVFVNLGGGTNQQVLLASSRVSDIGVFDIELFEFDDIGDNTWIELKISLNQEWLNNKIQNSEFRIQNYSNTKDDGSDTDNNIEITSRFENYMKRVAGISEMKVIESNKDTVVSRIKVQSRFVEKNLKNTKFGFLKITRDFEFINPFSSFLDITSGDVADEDAGSFILMDQPLDKWGYVFKNGYPVSSNVGVTSNIYDYLGITLDDIKNSNVTYNLATNRKVSTKDQRVKNFYRQKFLSFESKLYDVKDIDVQILYPNTVGYNIILIGVGAFVVILCTVIFRMKKRGGA